MWKALRNFKMSDLWQIVWKSIYNFITGTFVG